MHVPPIRVTYNQACEILSISRDTLRNLQNNDPDFPKSIKQGTKRQSAVYFDYADLVAWHNSKKAEAMGA